MTTNQKKVIATLVKEGRQAKGYTQKELSDLSNISVRSIQRIENGEIQPRSYTLKTLSQVLDISFEEFSMSEAAEIPGQGYKLSKGQKIILSIGIPLFVFFACLAFIAQSSTFPETDFELMILITFSVVFVSATLFAIWRTKA